MLTWSLLIFTAAISQSDPSLVAPQDGYAPYAASQAPIGGGVPAAMPGSYPCLSDGHGCEAHPPCYPDCYPVAPITAPMMFGVPVPYGPPVYAGPVVLPYGRHRVAVATPYSFAHYPVYYYPHLPHQFSDLRVRSKWHMSPGNMFPPLMGEPAAHGYYYFKPYNYNMVPYQQQAASSWGESVTQPYNGPLQDGLAARAAAQQAALSARPWTLPPGAPQLLNQPGLNESAIPASNHFQQQPPALSGSYRSIP